MLLLLLLAAARCCCSLLVFTGKVIVVARTNEGLLLELVFIDIAVAGAEGHLGVAALPA